MHAGGSSRVTRVGSTKWKGDGARRWSTSASSSRAARAAVRACRGLYRRSAFRKAERVFDHKVASLDALSRERARSGTPSSSAEQSSAWRWNGGLEPGGIAGVTPPKHIRPRTVSPELRLGDDAPRIGGNGRRRWCRRSCKTVLRSVGSACTGGGRRSPPGLRVGANYRLEHNVGTDRHWRSRYWTCGWPATSRRRREALQPASRRG